MPACEVDAVVFVVGQAVAVIIDIVTDLGSVRWMAASSSSRSLSSATKPSSWSHEMTGASEAEPVSVAVGKEHGGVDGVLIDGLVAVIVDHVAEFWSARVDGGVFIIAVVVLEDAVAIGIGRVGTGDIARPAGVLGLVSAAGSDRQEGQGQGCEASGQRDLREVRSHVSSGEMVPQRGCATVPSA